MPTRNLVTVLAAVLLAVVAAGAGEASAADNPKKEASLEMEFGFKSARRGYWQEALQRFERANELTPNQPRILNNIAVAQEANGLFEQALLTYQTGLAIDSNDKALRRNYARFQEFYASQIAPPERSPEEDDSDGDKTPNEDDDAHADG